MEDFDFNQYYQNHEVDFAWLEKPSQHEFRWRCDDGSWRKSKGESVRLRLSGNRFIEIIPVTSTFPHLLG